MSDTVPTSWLVYCRPGFENDALAEMQHHAQQLDVSCESVRGEGWVSVTRQDGEAINDLHRRAAFHRLIFARQSLAALPALALSRDDRLTAILEQIKASRWSFEDIWHETPDTNEGKALAGLIKALTKPLQSMLKKRGALRKKAGGRRLHIFWTDGDRVQLGMSFPDNRSDLINGIRRLRFSFTRAQPLDVEVGGSLARIHTQRRVG